MTRSIVTLSIKILGIKILSIRALSIKILSITTLSIAILSRKLNLTLSIKTLGRTFKNYLLSFTIRLLY